MTEHKEPQARRMLRAFCCQQILRIGMAFAVLLLLPLLSCASAQMVNNPASDKIDAYGPVRRSQPQTGMVKYSADGTSSQIQERKRDAYKQMYNACGGSYEITTENIITDGASGTAVAGPIPGTNLGFASGTSQQLSTWVIQFRCVPGPARKRVERTSWTYDQCHEAGGIWTLFANTCKLPDDGDEDQNRQPE